MPSPVKGRRGRELDPEGGASLGATMMGPGEGVDADPGICGNGADGGGAGGPNATIDMPKSSSGSEDRGNAREGFLREGVLLVARGASSDGMILFAGAASRASMVRFGLEKDVALASGSVRSGGEHKSDSRRPAIVLVGPVETPACCTVPVEREGFKLRIGRGMPGRNPLADWCCDGVCWVELRIFDKKGAWSERICMLVGRLSDVAEAAGCEEGSVCC